MTTITEHREKIRALCTVQVPIFTHANETDKCRVIGENINGASTVFQLEVVQLLKMFNLFLLKHTSHVNQLLDIYLDDDRHIDAVTNKDFLVSELIKPRK